MSCGLAGNELVLLLQRLVDPPGMAQLGFERGVARIRRRILSP